MKRVNSERETASPIYIYMDTISWNPKKAKAKLNSPKKNKKIKSEIKQIKTTQRACNRKENQIPKQFMKTISTPLYMFLLYLCTQTPPNYNQN